MSAARAAIRSRALLTGIAITLIFGSVVAVLWVGAQSVLAGTLSAGTLGQFLLYSVICRRLARRAVGSLGRTLAGGRRRRPADRTAGRGLADRRPRQARSRCPHPAAAASNSPTCISPIRRVPANRRCTG